MSTIAAQVLADPVPIPPEIQEDLKQELAWIEEQEALLIAEDNKPVDSLFSELQMRLLVETLYTGWEPPPNKRFPQGERSFWAACNVGVFAAPGQPAIVPDVFLGLDVVRPKYPKYKSFYCWRMGKPPDIVIEIVSGTDGHELDTKKQDYEDMRVPYYVVFDPFQFLKQGVLQVFGWNRFQYEPIEQLIFAELGLGLTFWHGVYEKSEETFLRWVDADGNLLPTGDERAAREAERAEREAERAELAIERAERMAARLRELGIDPEQV
ncbi:MAG TPA: Uma2 family endonuclease [Blastocatellia bacterium]|nr:Uma2 family endonuclease [Blastocatellia bacterium]HMV83133.1 Uma2 family endonuclease [Blastocatellia bacterium]HMX26342.1 Uma2 family endonuclease [Blastocatellia bacterium]HMY70644.1 Uma2 family endonuclease [Blastocatellia bacterium]HMZ20081.1 Uma2 family endonuclease [Blastocatellia bacterium]